MSSNSLFGYLNYFSNGTITATSSETGLGPTNLASQQCAPSSGYQTPASVVTSAGGAELRVDSADAGVIWRAWALVQTNFTPYATVTATLWLTSGPTMVASMTAWNCQPGYRQIVGVFDQDYTADYCIFQMNDASNPDSHINVGGAFAGAAWLPSYGWTWGTENDMEVRTSQTFTRGGQEHSTPLNTKRVLLPRLDRIMPGEVWDRLGELRRVSALRQNVLAIPDVTDVDINRTAVYGTVDQPDRLNYPNAGLNLRGWGCRITERL